jgi:hypothetical protein
MTIKASRAIGGWLVAVTTWARGEDSPRVSLFDVATLDPNDAMDAVRKACGAPADAVAIKAHVTKGALALMRIEPGHVRMRKSNTTPRDIHDLTRRIREIATIEDQGSDSVKRKGR